MKSFVEYIVEANAEADRKHRAEALHVFNRVATKLKRLVDSKSTQHMELSKFNETRVHLHFDLGNFIGDSRYKGLRLLFTDRNRYYSGSYGKLSDATTIELAVMGMRYEPRPGRISTPEDADLPDFMKSGMIGSNAFLYTKDVSNYEQIVKAIKERRPEIRDVFVHEFVHHMDTFRYKDANYVNVPSYNDRLGYGKEYFNHPKELNAHTQEIITHIDEWYKSYYVSTVNMIKNNLVKKFNAAQNTDQCEDVMFLSSKLLRHHEMLVGYLSNKTVAIHDIRAKIPTTKQNFGKHLTRENKQKILVRLYQYYDEVLSKRFRLLKASLEKLPKQLNNDVAALYIKNRVPETYAGLRKLGMK